MIGYLPLLDVNLTTGELSEREITERVRREWIGGTGLGLRLLAAAARRDLDVRDPECPVLVLTGPLTGTGIPQSSDWVIVTVNADLPGHVCASHSHGYFGARLRQAGWDGVVLHGRAPEPVYLVVGDDGVEIRAADAVWGRDTYDTDSILRSLVGTEEAPASVACIGPAGENLVYGASVRIESAFGASQGGAGVAWGAKNLKAIVVSGTHPVEVSDPTSLVAVAEAWSDALRTQPLKPIEAMHADGLRIMPDLGPKGLVPGKNFTDPAFGLMWSRRLARDLPRWRVEAVGSWNCEMACHHRTECTTGAMAGVVATGYGGEVMEELGPNLGIEDPSIALALAAEVDRLGLSAGWVPRVIAMLMEAFGAGEIDVDTTGGLDLSWGNFEAVFELLHQTVRREGLGSLVAQGLRPTAQSLGIEHRAVHMKGGGFNDHDQRAGPLMLFQSQVASGAGPTWQSAVSLAVGSSGSEPDIGLTAFDPHDLQPIARATLLSQEKKMWEDSLGVCYFAARGIRGILDMETRAVEAATGFRLPSEEALRFGERLIHLQRLVMLELGYDCASDFDIAPRMLGKLEDGPAAGVGLEMDDLRAIRAEYYESLGWSTETGLPSREALERVGLAELADEGYAL